LSIRIIVNNNHFILNPGLQHMWKRIFFKNWRIKVFSVIFATFLVASLSGDQFKTEVFPRSFIIEAKNIPTNLRISSDLPAVQIKIRAPTKLWNYITPADFSLFIDLVDATSGTTTYPIQAKVANPQIVLIETIPATVGVTIQEVESRTMAVTLKTSGKPADGYELGQMESEQKEVKISGIKATLDEVKKVTGVVDIANADRNTKQNIKILLFDAQDRQLSTLDITPQTLSVVVNIKPITITKTVPIEPLLSEDITSKWRAGNFSLSPNIIMLQGPKNILSKITTVQTESITADDITKKAFLKKVVLNPEIQSIDRQQSIQVTFNEKALPVTPSASTRQKTFTIQPNFKSLDSHIKIVSFSPSNIDIVVSGTDDKLQDLTANDFSCNIDLSSVKGPGNYVLPIESSMIYTPSSIKIDSVQAKNISIVVDSQ